MKEHFQKYRLLYFIAAVIIISGIFSLFYFNGYRLVAFVTGFVSFRAVKYLFSWDKIYNNSFFKIFIIKESLLFLAIACFLLSFAFHFQKDYVSIFVIAGVIIISISVVFSFYRNWKLNDWSL